MLKPSRSIPENFILRILFFYTFLSFKANSKDQVGLIHRSSRSQTDGNYCSQIQLVSWALSSVKARDFSCSVKQENKYWLKKRSSFRFCNNNPNLQILAFFINEMQIKYISLGCITLKVWNLGKVHRLTVSNIQSYVPVIYCK